MSRSRYLHWMGDIALALVAVGGAVAPFLQEKASDEMSMGSVSSDPSLLVAIKIALAAVILAFFLILVVRRGRGNCWKSLARLPVVRSSLLAGAVVALGLASFDICTAYHASGGENSGHCFCWLTGVSTALGGLIAGIACMAGRAFTAILADAVRVVMRFLFVLMERFNLASSQRVAPELLPITVGVRSARRIAGRAPPLK